MVTPDRLLPLMIGLSLVLVVASDPAWSEVTACPDERVRVQADPEMSQLVCRSVERARALLSQCGLEQSRLIRVEIVSSFEEPHQHCVAMFDCSSDTMTLLPPGSLDGNTIAMDFQQIPAEEHFDMLLVHELTHAFISHTATAPVPRLAHEYLAYSMQIASLLPQNRSDFLEKYADAAPGDPALINIFILEFSPGLFAANAYQHFSAPGRGCDLAKQILIGDSRLPDALLPGGGDVHLD